MITLCNRVINNNCLTSVYTHVEEKSVHFDFVIGENARIYVLHVYTFLECSGNYCSLHSFSDYCCL